MDQPLLELDVDVVADGPVGGERAQELGRRVERLPLQHGVEQREAPPAVGLMTVLLGLLIIVRHRSNIGRMIRRDEPRMDGPAESAA